MDNPRLRNVQANALGSVQIQLRGCLSDPTYPQRDERCDHFDALKKVMPHNSSNIVIFLGVDYATLENQRCPSQHFSFFTGGVNFRLSLVTYFNTSK